MTKNRNRNHSSLFCAGCDVERVCFDHVYPIIQVFIQRIDIQFITASFQLLQKWCFSSAHPGNRDYIKMKKYRKDVIFDPSNWQIDHIPYYLIMFTHQNELICSQAPVLEGCWLISTTRSWADVFWLNNSVLVQIIYIYLQHFSRIAAYKYEDNSQFTFVIQRRRNQH